MVYSPRGNKLTPDENGVYSLTWAETYRNTTSNSTQYNNREVYVGYPKSIYNEENGNLIINNTAELWGPYGSSSAELEYLNEDNVTIDLSTFSFTYPLGNIANIGKTRSSYDYMYYQYISRDLSKTPYVYWYLTPQVNYHGKPITVKIGDDLMYSTDSNGQKTRVEDDDYYFNYISFPTLYNSGYRLIPDNTYDCELWIRYAGEEDYVLYSEFKNDSKTWNFTKDNQVVGFYFIIKDMNEGLASNTSKGYIYCETIFKRDDISREGTLYNFDYIQVYERNEDNELVWINQWSEENYSTLMTQMEIATYDKETYNGYVQRSVSSINWSYYNVNDPAPYGYPRIYAPESNEIIQDEENEEFKGEYDFRVYIKPYSSSYYYEEEFFDDYDKNKMIDELSFYLIIPKGMIFDSTRKEIIDSISYKYDYNYITMIDSDKKAYSFSDVIKPAIQNMTMDITENWKGTGQTKVSFHIPFDQKYFVFYKGSTTGDSIYGSFNVTVSYDSYIEYGATYNAYIYSEVKSDTYAQTAGSKDSNDVNDNGITTDYMYYDNDSCSIISVISSHQDVLTQVSSTLSNFASGVISAEYDKTYTYKLRVRTGQNDVTNLVVYDNLESWSRNKDGEYKFLPGKRNYWQGSLESIDTSYAENKGFNVKVWYSENEKAGTLAEDSSWKEYSDSVDKTKVKSLAFQYLDSEGKPIVVPGNTLTYILINMKAPSGDPKIRTLAYNACWTQWNAIDVMGEMVDEITGITSNTVKVALPDTVAAETIPSIKLIVKKDIVGDEEAFENMGLDPNGTYNFQITLVRNNEDGSQSEVTGVVTNKTNLVISSLEEGTWLIKESDEPYFDFVSMVEDNDSEFTTPGVIFEETDEGYVLVVDEDVDADAMFTIKVTNEIEPDRHYEDKEDKTNLFSTQEEETTTEPTSLIDKLIDLFE